MTEDKHAVFSPSAAKRWINCPGSINACKDLPPQKPNFYSAEGTVAHEWAAQLISANLTGDPSDILIKIGDKVKQNGFDIPITQEMFLAVNTYVCFVTSLAEKYDEQPEIERKVKITDDCFGTADSIIYSPYRILIVNDYKHGAGIQVDAEMNEQMMIYAIGKLMELPGDELDELPLVEMNIIQPRGSGETIKTFRITTKELIAWYEHILLPAIKAAKQPNAPLNPGDWCKYCPAALTCPALKKENLAVAKLAFEEPTKWIDVLTPKAIADLLDKESMVMAFYKRLNEHAAELASKNIKIPGYTYEKKWGNRKWKDELFAEKFFKDCEFKEKEMYDIKFKSPAQIEKMLKSLGDDFDPFAKGEFIKVIPGLTEKPFTGYALKKANGKEITVKEVFGEIE
jgi:hypothetical protein